MRKPGQMDYNLIVRWTLAVLLVATLLLLMNVVNTIVTPTGKVIVTPSNKYASNTIPGIDKNYNMKRIPNNIYPKLLSLASSHPRKRKMFDLTKVPEQNSLQVMVNTWFEGSYSPVHLHTDYSEVEWPFF